MRRLTVAPSQPASARSGRQGLAWLLWAVALFIVVKLAWILLPLFPMGLPRLGDDALVYLWNGVNNVAHPHNGQRGLLDIQRLRDEPAIPDSVVDRDRARVAMRTTGINASPVALGVGAALAAGASPKAAFALLEAFVAICLALAVAYINRRLQGSRAAALALASLAFAILPNQGLHYLIPGVLALAIALVLWGALLHRQRQASAVLLLAVLMLAVHPIGPVYLCAGIAIVTGYCLVERRAERRSVAYLAALFAAYPAWLLIQQLTGARQPATSGLGGFSLTQAGVNAGGLWWHLRMLASWQPLLTILAIGGFVASVRQRRRRPGAFLLAGVLLAAMVAAVLIDIPGYPGELSSRALVPLVVIGTGAGWQAVLDWLDGHRRDARWALAAVAMLAAAQLPGFLHVGFHNANMRHQIYDSHVLQHEVARLSEGSVVVWNDTDVAMMAGFLAGADRVRALPLPMVDGLASLRRETANASSVWVATALPERLNGTSSVKAWSLRPRYYGYGFDYFSRISFRAPDGVTLPAFLRLGGAGMDRMKVTDGANRLCQLRASTVAGWYAIEGCAGARVLSLESAARSLRLTGFGERPDEERAWPWAEQGVELEAVPRTDHDPIRLSFDYKTLLGERAAADIASAVGPLQLVSTNSGIVWLRARPGRDRQP